jgi:hypothetical protein
MPVHDAPMQTPHPIHWQLFAQLRLRVPPLQQLSDCDPDAGLHSGASPPAQSCGHVLQVSPLLQYPSPQLGWQFAWQSA